jgi:ABC-type nitrate/sulfonate/bicarbonate transport system permease component
MATSARTREAIGTRAVQVGFAVVIFGLWFYLTAAKLVHRVVLPPPMEVWAVAPKVLFSRGFLVDLWTTLYEIIVSFFVSALIGVAVGYFLSRSIRRAREYEPLLSAIYAIPMFLFYPVFVLTFGLGPASKIAVGTLIGFFPVVLATVAGFTGVNKTHITAARTMGASNYQMLRWVMLPAALPVIATGLRMGLVITLLTVFGSETLGSRIGLGFNMIALGEGMETARMYVYIIVIVLIAVVLNSAATKFERMMQTRDVEA